MSTRQPAAPTHSSHACSAPTMNGTVFKAVRQWLRVRKTRQGGKALAGPGEGETLRRRRKQKEYGRSLTPLSSMHAPSSCSGSRWQTRRRTPTCRTAPHWSSMRRRGTWCCCPGARTARWTDQRGPKPPQLPSPQPLQLSQRPLAIGARVAGAHARGRLRTPGRSPPCPLRGSSMQRLWCGSQGCAYLVDGGHTPTSGRRPCNFFRSGWAFPPGFHPLPQIGTNVNGE